MSRQSAYLVRPQQVIRSAESRLDYRIERLLGAGGFGQVFLASRLGRSGTVPQVVCVKVSAFIDGWVREAYFGDLLGSHERAIRIYDRFPIARDDGQMLYCLAMEYAAHHIRFNTVSPGIINTPMHASGNHEMLAKFHPLARMGEIADIVGAVLYLQEATFVTGENIHLDGGVHAGRP